VDTTDAALVATRDSVAIKPDRHLELGDRRALGFSLPTRRSTGLGPGKTSSAV
jgi:hypothetical protein